MKKLIYSLAVASLIISCKKTDAPVNNCVVNESSIAGKYTINSIKYKSSSTDTETDWFSSLPDCQKDDIYELKADGSVVISEGNDNCGLPPNPGMATSWSLDSNNTILRMEAFQKIESFDCSKLVVSEENLLVDGDIKTTTYVKQ